LDGDVVDVDQGVGGDVVGCVRDGVGEGGGGEGALGDVDDGREEAESFVL
jgi:hypothetical protein